MFGILKVVLSVTDCWTCLWKQQQHLDSLPVSNCTNKWHQSVRKLAASSQQCSLPIYLAYLRAYSCSHCRPLRSTSDHQSNKCAVCRIGDCSLASFFSTLIVLWVKHPSFASVKSGCLYAVPLKKMHRTHCHSFAACIMTSVHDFLDCEACSCNCFYQFQLPLLSKSCVPLG